MNTSISLISNNTGPNFSFMHLV
jgi:hypothetical protein